MIRPGTWFHSGHRFSGARLLPVGLLCVLWLCGCAPGGQRDERNLHYIRGMKLRDQKRYEEAAEAFRKCLRSSPESAKAHLQLALLYEKALNDPLRCVYHYRCFLDMRPDDPHAEVVRSWMAEAEIRLANELRRHHAKTPVAPGHPRNPAAPPAGAPASSPEKPPAADPGLLQRLRELATMNADLKKRLAEVSAELQHRREQALTYAKHLRDTGKKTEADKPSSPQSTAENPSPSPGPATTQERIHRVKAGDSLSSLARKYYGHLRYWPMLRDYNRDVLHGKETLRVGMALKIPPVDKLTKKQDIPENPPGRHEEGTQ